MYMCAYMGVPGANGGPKRASVPLASQLQKVESCSVDAGNGAASALDG